MNNPYWLTTAKLPSFPKPQKNLKIDIAIIGAGITGITAAYLLKRAGKKVALFERDRCAHADTAHTTAHLTCVTDLRLHELVHTFGRDHAKAVWDSGLAAINTIQDIIQQEKITCNFQRIPGYLHAPLNHTSAPSTQNSALTASLQKDTQLATELGFDATYLDAIPLFQTPGMRIANQAKFHPLKYLAALLKKIPGNGSHVFENSEASDFTAQKDQPLTFKSNHKTITCDYLIIATHVPLMGKNSLLAATLFQSKIFPYSTYAIGAKLPKNSRKTNPARHSAPGETPGLRKTNSAPGGNPGPASENHNPPEASFWDTNDPYNYLRIDRHPTHDYAILGGKDHKTGQTIKTEPLFQSLERNLHNFSPTAKVDHHWSGQVIETNDGLPLIGELSPKQFIATGFSGNGITFGILSAMMAADAALNQKNPWQKLYDPHRKKILGGTWNYIKENADYPYYMLLDRLTSAEAQSEESIKPNEGKILKLNNERIAAYRDPKGKLTLLSPICTHLGCLVHFNTAEKTWDCPCHGSRFKPTGEVLAGPAEDPLQPKKPNQKKK